jgi:Domain of unknown function (DUF3291)
VRRRAVALGDRETEDGDATAVRVFDDDRLIVNLTVWESLEHLADFVFGRVPRRCDAPPPGVVSPDP